MKRTATSTRDLERVEVMGRVAQEGLKLVDAAAMLQLSYRKVKRMWRRYQQVGRQVYAVFSCLQPSHSCSFMPVWSLCKPADDRMISAKSASERM